MRLQREQYFSLMGLTRVVPLERHARGSLELLYLRMRQPGDRPGSYQTAAKIAP
jgi:hypothetical protein